MMTNITNEHPVRETKIENSPSVQQAAPLPSMQGVMPLYGANQPEPATFNPPGQPRFPNTVWHQANADPNTLGAWTPQGQFIQQVPSHQVEDIRYPQYNVAPYPPQPTAVPVSSYQTAFMQQNGGTGSYSTTNNQGPQPSPTPMHNGSARATPVSGVDQQTYVEQSPRPSEQYINGNYQHSQDVVNGGGPSTPVSRCGSAGQLDGSTGSGGGNASVAGNGTSEGGKYTNPPTPTTPQQQTQQQQGNGMPGYPQQPPQAQSSHNSSGYPGQETSLSSNGMIGEANRSQQSKSRDIWNGNMESHTEQVNSHKGDAKELQWSLNGQQASWEKEERQERVRTNTQDLWSASRADQQNCKETTAQENTRPPDPWQGQATAEQTMWQNRQEQWDTQKSAVQESWSNQKSTTSQSQEVWSSSKGTSTQESWTGNQKTMQDSWTNGNQKESNSPQTQQQQWQEQSAWMDKKDVERSELNNRLKTMILNKQYQESRRTEEARQSLYQDQNDFKQRNSSENFLSVGHHPQASEGGGARAQQLNKSNYNCQTEVKQCYQPPAFAVPENPAKKEEAVQWSGKTEESKQPSRCKMQSNKEAKPEPYWESGFSPWINNSYVKQEDSTKFPSYYAPYVYGYDPRFTNPVKFIDGKLKIPEYPVYSSVGVGNFPVDPSWHHCAGGISSPQTGQVKEGFCREVQTDFPADVEGESPKPCMDGIDFTNKPAHMSMNEFVDYVERLKNNARTEIPSCKCFAGETIVPPEPGTFYTHLGASASLADLRASMEKRTGLSGEAIRMEKILYTGKEGKTTSGCPLAKWVIRRGSLDEKILMVVKHRTGHTCNTAYIVVAIVAWEGVPSNDADNMYTLLTYKLNRFGLATKRRCATNEPRTCACQGLDPELCGASFSFGCSWSMYYNGCKFARSKSVRKYRLTVKTEEKEVEDKMEKLATILAPLYKAVAPDSFENQVQFEKEASDCRLGLKPGRPFSGVTACIDFCAHSHRDLHNMNNGCTVVVSLTKHRTLAKPDDEQLHVLPLYIMDDTDEFGSQEGQLKKVNSGAIENLTEFPCEVRVRSVPLSPCRRKKRKEPEVKSKLDIKSEIKTESSWSQCESKTQLQISQISSTVCDSVTQTWASSNNPAFTSNLNKPDLRTSQPSFHTNSYGTWNTLNLNNGLPLDDRIKEDPDSTTISPLNKIRRCDWTENNFVHVKQERQEELSRMCIPTEMGRSIKQEAANTVKREQVNFKPSQFSTSSSQSLPHFNTLVMSQNSMQTSTQHGLTLPASVTRNTGHDLNSNHYYGSSIAATDNSAQNQNKINHFMYRHSNSQENLNKEAARLQENEMRIKSEHGMPSEWGLPPGGNFLNHNLYPPGYGSGWSQVPQVYSTIHPLLQLQNSFSQSQPPPVYSYQSGGNQFLPWNSYGPNPYPPEQPKPEPVGNVAGIADNKECFLDSQMGGVAIALGHGSVLFECAKHELHSTTALQKPNRKHPTRISLVFYQHRNLNRSEHGATQWQEKMKLRAATAAVPVQPRPPSPIPIQQQQQPPPPPPPPPPRMQAASSQTTQTASSFVKPSIHLSPPIMPPSSPHQHHHHHHHPSMPGGFPPSQLPSFQSQLPHLPNQLSAAHQTPFSNPSWPSLFPINPCTVSNTQPA